MTSGKESKAPAQAPWPAALPPAEGERRAQRGYVSQYDKAGAAIYAELERGQLLWIGVADRTAGILDDLVLGFDGRVVGHQFKSSRYAGTFTVETLFIGANGLLSPLVHAWQSLCAEHAYCHVEIRIVTNDHPSTTDQPGDETPAHSAAFLEELANCPNRPLDDWLASSWTRLVGALHKASGLEKAEFESFIHALRVMHGADADFVQVHRLSAEKARLAAEIAQLLPRLVADKRDKDRWSRAELLQELRWHDPAKLRHVHRFPVGAYAQRNRDTEVLLLEALRAVDTGYVALVGPPGSGKSTLLQMALATEPDVRLIRYLAYLPTAAQGAGRGEADHFLEDVCTQMRNSGLLGMRLRDTSLYERRQQFEAFLVQAGERFADEGVRTIIVVDGLDHIPREEHPEHSFLKELPLPVAVPKGVTFVLGTQRLDLAHLPPAVQDQAKQGGRLVTMRALSRDAVAAMADALDLDAEISRPTLFELSQGHPLATRYLIQALLRADAAARTRLLAGSLSFDGDIEAVYRSAWREIAGDEQAMHAMGFIARAESPISLPLLATVVDEAAIERALKSARHLMKEAGQGWSVFHNSFRLFLLEQPRIRLGSVIADYSQQIYRQLADLARGVPAGSSQQWLELRYRARAGDGDAVLALATPQRFRQDLAQGRSVSEIQADIRLALQAVRTTHDATSLTRLLLCRDEVSRRTTALEYTRELPIAMLAVGDIDAAYGFVQEFPSQGYEVVDALLKRGEFDRAKALFEHLEPLSQLHTSRFANHGTEHNLAEFDKWAKRVFHFRDFEQIQRSIDSLASEGSKQAASETAEDASTRIAERLRQQIAVAVLAHSVDADPGDIVNKLNLDPRHGVMLSIEAGLAVLEAGDAARAMALFLPAIDQPSFEAVPNGWRRMIALTSATTGRQDVAALLFDKLTAPMVSMGDDDSGGSTPGDLVKAVLQHAQLCTLLGKPVPAAKASKHPLIKPLQTHAENAGTLLGNAQIDPSSISPGTVQMACRAAVGYVARLVPQGGSDFFQVSQAIRAAPILAKTFLQVGTSCGEAEYRAVQQEIDDATGRSTQNGISYLQREVAVAAYGLDGDRTAAAARLEKLVDEHHERTPTEQIDGLATLAIAFAAIGDARRGRELLAAVPDHVLGNALAARKDPQYVTWRNILVLANAADPDERSQRVAHLMRQVAGMNETEGDNAAHRLTMTLIDEAMQVSSRFGAEVAHALADCHLVSWPNRVDLTMGGLLRRRPEALQSSLAVWCGLTLPFYKEPHYRDPTHVGDFIDIAMDAAGAMGASELVTQLLEFIQVDGRAHERLRLLQRLDLALRRQGHADSAVSDAIARWSSDAPKARHSDTPSRYDDAATLEELERAFEADGGALEHNAPYRFLKLATSAAPEQVRRMYERWEALQSHTRCRFLIVKLLTQAGETDYARSLIQQYESGSDPYRSWSQWLGGGNFFLFQARHALDGASMHGAAFENLVDSLNAGEENTGSLLAEIDDILPVITAAPDWPAIWAMLAEQMTTTREFRLGTAFNVSSNELTDEELLGDLLYFALRLPVEEVQRHARGCALALSAAPIIGAGAFELTMRRLLAGALNEPLQALSILGMDSSDSLSGALGPLVTDLANHRDLAVAEAAVMLAGRWGMPVSGELQPLPLFYQLDVGGPLEDDDGLDDAASGAMRVENTLGWTRLLRSVSQALAEAADCSELNIRRRAAMFIQEWGGLEAFGAPAIQRLQKQLRAIDMQITYLKPHAMVGVLALRHVAGELRRAGLLSRRDMPSLLERLNAPLPHRPYMRPQIRPPGLSRPLPLSGASFREAEKLWVEQVGADVVPWSERRGEHIVAEVSKFKFVLARRAEYSLRRLRSPGPHVEGEDFWGRYQQLPAAVWIGQTVPLDDHLAPTLVRRFVSSFGFGLNVPDTPITLCPNWLRHLRWHPDGPNTYRDVSGAVVAKYGWWRDAGPADIDDDFLWGEGCFLSLTNRGLGQVMAVRRGLIIQSFASRDVQMARDDGGHFFQAAIHSFAIEGLT